MFNLYDNEDIANFKTRLAKARNDKHLTQEKFAEAIHAGERTRISNWENPTLKTLLHLADLPTICKVLEVDPNYLLGFSDDKCSNDTEISNDLHLSIDSIKIIRNEPYLGKLLDYILASDELYRILHQTRQICVSGYHAKTLENIFSKKALTKLNSAFTHFFTEVFYLDMSPNIFSTYLPVEFPWSKKKKDFFEFLDTIIIEPKYRNMLLSNEEFMSLDDDDKYDALMYDIAKASYNHLMSNHTAELSAQKISNLISDIIFRYIQEDISAFKNRLDK